MDDYEKLLQPEFTRRAGILIDIDTHLPGIIFLQMDTKLVRSLQPFRFVLERGDGFLSVLQVELFFYRLRVV